MSDTTGIKEGPEFRGGVKKKPTTPPPALPKGQSGQSGSSSGLNHNPAEHQLVQLLDSNHFLKQDNDRLKVQVLELGEALSEVLNKLNYEFSTTDEEHNQKIVLWQEQIEKAKE